LGGPRAKAYRKINVQHTSNNFPRICGGHLIFLNIPPIKEECYYACSLRVRSILGLLEKRRAIAPNS